MVNKAISKKPSTHKSHRESSFNEVGSEQQPTQLKELFGLLIHVWSSEIKFENQDGTLIFLSPAKLFSSYIDSSTIPSELIPCFNKANCNFVCGYLLAKIFDYRHLPDLTEKETVPSQAVCREVLLKPTHETTQAELSHLLKEQNAKISQEDAFRLEAELLVAYNPTLDLRVDEASQRINTAMSNILSLNSPPKPKCLKNSSEIENEEAGRIRLQALMKLMDDKPSRRETDGMFSMVDNLRKKRAATDETFAQGLESKKTKARRSSIDINIPGFKVIRTLRFDDVSGKNIFFAIFNLFEGPHGQRKGILRQGSSPNSSMDSFTKEFNFNSAAHADEYISNFIQGYSDLYDLTFDSNASQTSATSTSNKTHGVTNAPKPLPSETQTNPKELAVTSLSSIPIPSASPNIKSPGLQSATDVNNLKPPPQSVSTSLMGGTNALPNTSLPIQLTAQQIAEYQMARKKQLIQQGIIPPDFKGELTNAQLQQLQFMSANAVRPNQGPGLRPQFSGYNMASLQAQQIQQLQQMQQFQQNGQNFTGSPQMAMSQQGKEPMTQQQLLEVLKRKQAYENLLKQQQMGSQSESNQSAIRPNQPVPGNPARPPSLMASFTPQQRLALSALQNKQPLTDQQNQTIDDLLRIPSLPEKFKQIVNTMRSQVNAMNQAQPQTEAFTPAAPQAVSKAPELSSEVSTTSNLPTSVAAQQAHGTPLQPGTPQSSHNQFTSNTGTPRMQPSISAQATPRISQGMFSQPPNTNLPQAQFPMAHQQQAYAALQQHALDANQINILQALQQIPNPTPQQQNMLNMLQSKHTQYLMLQKKLLAQHQALQAKQLGSGQNTNPNQGVAQQAMQDNKSLGHLQNNLQQQGTPQQLNAQQLHNLQQQQLNAQLRPHMNPQHQLNMQQHLNAQMQSQMMNAQQQQNFSSQQQSQVQTPGASANTPGDASQSNTMLTGSNPPSILSPHEQQTIRMNTLQQQQAIHINAQRRQLLAQYQQQLMLAQTPGMRPRPMTRPTLQQQQMYARYQQQAMLNPANQLAAQNHMLAMNLAQQQGMRPGHPGVHPNMMSQLSRPTMEGMTSNLTPTGAHVPTEGNTPGTPQAQPFPNQPPQPQ